MKGAVYRETYQIAQAALGIPILGSFARSSERPPYGVLAVAGSSPNQPGKLESITMDLYLVGDNFFVVLDMVDQLEAFLNQHRFLGAVRNLYVRDIAGMEPVGDNVVVKVRLLVIGSEEV